MVKEMNKIILNILLLMLASSASAQRLSHRFEKTSLSDALVWLDKAQSAYHLNFIYDDLEDFTVTTAFQNADIHTALQRIIGFYPIKATFDKKDIYLECTQKEKQNLIGHVVDEKGMALEFVNIQLLSVSDTAFINGGVSNEHGDFVIPCAQRRVIAKVSYVGYKTQMRLVDNTNIGTIRLQPDAIAIKGVVVKGERPQYKMAKGGMTVDVEHSLLSKVGTASDVLNQLPRVNVNSEGAVSVFAKGTPEIYINNRLVREAKDLTELKSTDIKSVDVITSPGAQYNATVQSVIRIHAKPKQGEGWCIRTVANAKYNTEWGSYEQLDVKYRTGGLEFFSNSFFSTWFSGEDNTITSKMFFKDHTIRINEGANDVIRLSELRTKCGFNYDINDHHSFGAYYSVYKSLNGKGHSLENKEEVWRDEVYQGSITQKLEMEIFAGPNHELNLYYIGKVGQLDINANATYLWKKDGRNDSWKETSDGFEDRDVHTYNTRHNRMIAGKLILGYPIGKGTFNMGTELTHTVTHSIYENPEKYVEGSLNDIKESNVAPFADYSLTAGNWSIDAGLRYEHVTSAYYSFGIKEEAPSKTYDDWFPNVSLGWNKDLWSWQLSYTKKTRRPSYSSLRSNVQYDGRFTYEAGNPYLTPVTKHNIEMNVVYRWLNMSFGYNYYKNDILYTAGLYDDKEVGLIQNRNYSQTQDIYASVVASPKFDWYQPMLEIDFSRPFFNTLKYGSSEDLRKPSANFSLNSKFVITKHSFATLNMEYETRSYSGFVRSRAQSSVDVAYTHSFFHDVLLLNVYANDLFKKQRSAWTMFGQSIINTKNCYEYSRRIGVTLTYNFNVSRSKYKGTGAGNAEKNRL
jgi:hypothetical protein